MKDTSEYFCYCCNSISTNWYINPTSNKRNKFCQNCYELYSTSERKVKELNTIMYILSGTDAITKASEL